MHKKIEENQTVPPKIGAFYQCYKQPKAFQHVLSNFRKIYPDTDVIIFSDAGDDFNEYANSLNCKFIYEEKRTGNGISASFDKKEKLISWFKRLIYACEHIKEQYIMILEDDVWVKKPIEELSYDLNGVNKGEKMGKKITAFLKGRNSSIPKDCENYFYGGFGGSVINKNIILNNKEKIIEVIDAIDSQNLTDKIFITDYWLSIVYLYFGATIGQYNGLCETWYLTYPFMKWAGKISVLHHYKDLYE